MANFQNISPVLPASDIKSEIKFFEKLGFTNVYDSSRYSDKLDYAVVHKEGQYIHLQSHVEPKVPFQNTAQQIKVWVNDLDILQKEFEEKGFEINRQSNTAWGTDEFGFYSPNHNAIIFVKDLG